MHTTSDINVAKWFTRIPFKMIDKLRAKMPTAKVKAKSISFDDGSRDAWVIRITGSHKNVLYAL